MAMHNYNSVMAFFAAFSTAAVSRLKWTMGLLSKRAQEGLQEIERFMSNEMNYRTYRAAVAQAQSACVPYLGVHLSDLIFIEEGNPKYVEGSGLINFEGCRFVSNVITLMSELQEKPYTFPPVPELLSLLNKLPVMSEKHLYQSSLKREPRGQTPPDLVDSATGKKLGGLLRQDK